MAKLRMALYFGDKPNTGQYDNGVWMDLLGIPFIQRIEEAQNYDVVIRTLWIEPTVQGWSKEIRNRWPHITQIGLSDHPLSTHISKLPADQQLRYIGDLQYLDGILALTEEERQWYSVAVPSKPVIKVGLPFPFESYKENYSQLFNSPKKYIGLGVGAGDNDRNFISSWLVFTRLQLIYPDIQGVFLSVPSHLIPYCSQLADRSTNVSIQQRTEMGDYYDILSQCKFVISLADRNTPGRIQGEAAFFGIPVIGSERLELQRELFPELAVRPYELEDAFTKASILLKFLDAGNALNLSSSYKKLEKYNYTASSRKFNKLLKQIRG